jgi:(p)ppGpp synthase/HD superfamily hydrolase
MNYHEAYTLADELHAGQLDKGGQPYIGHLTRVAWRVAQAGGHASQIIAALLHDSIEDEKTTAEGLFKRGVPAAAISLVLLLTKRRTDPYPIYMGWLKQSADAVLIKRADIADNMDPARLEKLPPAQSVRLAEKYILALESLKSEATS